MRRIMAFAMGLALAGALAAQARAEGLKEKDLKVLDRAPGVLNALTSAPDKGIPRDLLDKSECVLVFPDVTKAAFGVGGEFGRGVATCRKSPGGEMGAPALFTIGGASIGWQIGGEQTDFVLLVMDKNGMDKLLRDNFKIGGDASVAAGPVGRSAEASTDVLLGAQMLSWSRSQGLFAGASLEGAVIKPNAEANERLYGHPITAREIFDSHPAVPAAARSYVDIASQLTSGTDATAEYRSHTETTATEEPYRNPSEPSTYRASSSMAAVDRDSGRVVSVTEDRLTVDTAEGRQVYTLDSATSKPMGLSSGDQVYVEHDGDLVANRITTGTEGELPRTASPLFAIGLAGALLLLAAYALRGQRRHAD